MPIGLPLCALAQCTAPEALAAALLIDSLLTSCAVLWNSAVLPRYHIVTTVLELLKMIRDYVKSAEAIPALLDQALPSAHCLLTSVLGQQYAAAV